MGLGILTPVRVESDQLADLTQGASDRLPVVVHGVPDAFPITTLAQEEKLEVRRVRVVEEPESVEEVGVFALGSRQLPFVQLTSAEARVRVPAPPPERGEECL